VFPERSVSRTIAQRTRQRPPLWDLANEMSFPSRILATGRQGAHLDVHADRRTDRSVRNLPSDQPQRRRRRFPQRTLAATQASHRARDRAGLPGGLRMAFHPARDHELAIAGERRMDATLVGFLATMIKRCDQRALAFPLIVAVVCVGAVAGHGLCTDKAGMN